MFHTCVLSYLCPAGATTQPAFSLGGVDGFYQCAVSPVLPLLSIFMPRVCHSCDVVVRHATAVSSPSFSLNSMLCIISYVCVCLSQVLFIKLMSVQDPDEEGYRSVSPAKSFPQSNILRSIP